MQKSQSAPDLSNIRKLDLKSFVSARLNEIQTLESEIQTKKTAKRVFQKLPRHLRRRTMSQNFHRMPKALRERAKQEIEALKPVTPKPKSKNRFRRQKRKPGLMLRDYERRQREYKWLETHIWHAKRFLMKNLWGYKFAISSRTKSQRPVYRAQSRQSILYDDSHRGTILIIGNQESLLSLLHQTTRSPISHVKGLRSGKILIYDFSRSPYPHGCVGPARYLFSPKGDAVWLMIHASCYDAALSLIERLSLNNYETKVFDMRLSVVKFEVLGPQSGLTIAEALNIRDSKLLDILRSRPSASPDGATLYLRASDPRVSRILVKNRRFLVELESSKPDPNLFLRWNNFSARFDELKLWRRDLTDLKPRLSEKELNQTSITIEALNEMQLDILLIQSGGSIDRGFGCGWTLIAPSGWGMAIFKALVFSRAKVVGLRDLNTLYLNRGVPQFPDDYPDTIAYQDSMKQIALEEEEQWRRKPPAKRVNFAALGIESPFLIPWETLFSENLDIRNTEFRIWVYRGYPEFSNLEKSKDEPFGLVGVRLSMDEGGTVPRQGARVFREGNVLIGFVTSGGYSLRCGMAIAMAFCRIKDILEIYRSDEKVLVQNKTSQFKHKAFWDLSLVY